MIPPPNVQDLGPWRVDLLEPIWNRVVRGAEALLVVGAINTDVPELGDMLAVAKVLGRVCIDSPDLTRILGMLAMIDGMHAQDWIRMRYVEATTPRRKPPPSTDLQMRLAGLQCRRLVCTLVRREHGRTVYEAHRVTIHNLRGDVSSAESSSFPNALEGALKMAGARKEDAA